VSSYSEADRDLTVASVVAILRFERLTWKDGTPIRIIMRPQTETDIGVLEHQSPALKEALGIARRQPAIPVGVTDQDNLALIAQTHGSVGFTALVSARVDAPELRVLPLGGVVPTSASVASGVYPWSKPLYVIVARRPDGRSEAFVDFVQSPAGRRLLERAGCLPAPKDASAQPGARS